MANSRLEKLGTIFGRVKSLIKAGALKTENRPIWFDVYARFGPRVEPSYSYKLPKTGSVRMIFYPEDVIRAAFHKKIKGQLPCFNLWNFSVDEDLTKRIIKAAGEYLEKYPELGDEGAIDKALEDLKKDGFLKARMRAKTAKTAMIFKELKIIENSNNAMLEKKQCDEQLSDGVVKVIKDKDIDISDIFKNK